MVGRFAGWLINFPALPNWVSIFQNSTGGSSTTSFTLQDHTFPVLWAQSHLHLYGASSSCFQKEKEHLRKALTKCNYPKWAEYLHHYLYHVGQHPHPKIVLGLCGR